MTEFSQDAPLICDSCGDEKEEYEMWSDICCECALKDYTIEVPNDPA